MEFARLAEQQVYDRVRESTTRIRSGVVPDPKIIDFLRQYGIDPRRSVFPMLGEMDANLYNGTVVSQHRRVYEFVIDTGAPEESSIEDVTDQLGPKDPRHPRSDIKDVITMSLVYFDRESDA